MNIQQSGEPWHSASLRGRVAIVTGAGQGIGRVFARAFAIAGAKVVIAERNVAKGRAVAAEIHGGGGQALAVPTDVADPRPQSRRWWRRSRRSSGGSTFWSTMPASSRRWRCARSSKFRSTNGTRSCA